MMENHLSTVAVDYIHFLVAYSLKDNCEEKKEDGLDKYKATEKYYFVVTKLSFYCDSGE